MDWLTQAITQRLNRLKDDIRATMEAKNINASHRTEKAFAVQQYEGGVRLVLGSGDVAPLDTLERGREGGAVPRGFYYIIKQWSRDKGISFGSESERSTFAYFAARKIAREGTKRHRNNEDVYTALTERAAEDCSKIISDEYKKVLANYLKF